MPNTIEECYRDIRRFNTLSQAVSQASGKLSESVESIVSVKKELSDKYLVNDSTTPIYGKFSDLQDKVDKTSNYLNNNVPSAISDIISKLYRRIAQLEAEAEAAAEEAAKKEAEAAVEEKNSSGSGGAIAGGPPNNVNAIK